MHRGTAALALPAGAAATLFLVYGRYVWEGPAGISWLVLAGTGVAGIAALWAAAWIRRRAGGAPVSPLLAALDQGLALPMGDALVAFDRAGRLVHANAEAARLAGRPAATLAGAAPSVFGPDLAILLKGLAHGAASGHIWVLGLAGSTRARTAAMRLPGLPVLDLALIRPDPTPPEAAGGPWRTAPEQASGLGRLQADIYASAAAELRGPIARACTSASLLRLALPRGEPILERQVAALEGELALAERRLSSLASAGRVRPGNPRLCDLAELVGDLLEGLRLPAGVRVRHNLAPSLVIADEAQLRQALHRILRSAASAMPEGGELTVALAREQGEAVLEIADSGAPRSRPIDLPVALSLLQVQGGRLELEPIPGRGNVCRIAFPLAGARSGGEPLQ